MSQHIDDECMTKYIFTFEGQKQWGDSIQEVDPIPINTVYVLTWLTRL